MVVIDVLVDEVGRRHGEHAQNLTTVALFETTERRAEGEACEQFGNRLTAVEIWRDAVEDLLKVGADATQSPIELQVAGGCFFTIGACSEFGGGALGIAPQGNGGAVGWVRREVACLRLNELDLALQSKVAGNARSETTNGMREHWSANAIDIASERHATEFGAGFNEDRLHAGARQVGGGNEAVVSATNHHHISSGGRLASSRRFLHLWWQLALGCGCWLQGCWGGLWCGLLGGHYASPRLLFKISSAASRPGAAMMPPPGWAEELASQ